VRVRLCLLGLCCLCASASCGGPCTVCEDVSGTYSETVPATGLTNSTCDLLYSHGSVHPVRVSSAGSRVELADLYGRLTHDPIAAELGDDLSVRVTYETVVEVDDGSGTTLPATVKFGGAFEGAAGARTFHGVYEASETQNDCSTRLRTDWTQVSP
jgi:hypothetical protein